MSSPIYSHRTILPFALTAAFLLALQAMPDLHAATYYWDSNDSTAGFGTAQGTWAAPTTNNSTQGWSTNATGTATLSGTTNTTTSDGLNFGTAANQLGTGTITVSGNVSAGSITIVSSSSEITLSGGNITSNGDLTATNSANTTALTHSISSNITYTANRAWNVNNGGSTGTAHLDFAGALSTTAWVTKAGNGTLTISGTGHSLSSTSVLRVSAGILALSSSNLTTAGKISVGTSANNGTLNITGNLTQTIGADPRNFLIGQYANNRGSVNVSGSANVNLKGMMLGDDSGGNGLFNQTGGTVNTGGQVWLNGQTSTLNVSGGTFNMGTQSLYMGAGTTYGSNSTITVNGTGSITAGSLIFSLSSRNATAMTVNLGDGSAGGNLSITGMSYGGGASSGATTINFNGGTLTANNTFSMITQATTVVKSGGAFINVVPSMTLTIGTALTDGGGGGGLTKDGTGNLILTGNNTYTGATTINSGQLNINSATAIGTGTLTINGGTIDNTSAAAITLSNNNAQNWNSDFAFTGTKDLNLGTGAVAMNATRTVTVSGGNLTVGGAISGAGFGLTKNGSGNLILSGANSYTGTTTVNAGTLMLGANQNLGVITGAGALNLSSYTFTTNASSDSTYSGVISGTGALTKNGTGTLTLSGTSTYNGSTTVNTGMLSVTGNISSSALTINSGGNLTGTGTVGAVTLNTGGMIGAGTGTSTIGKLSGASLSIGAGTGYAFTIGTVSTSVAGTDYDQIALTGGLTLSNTAASPFTVYLYGTPTGWSNTGDYSWDIISAASLSGFSAGNFTTDFTNFGIASGDRTGTWSFSNPSTGIIQLSYTAASGNSTWNSTTGNWDNAANWVENAIPVNGNNLTFNGTGGGTATNNISNATLTIVKNITFASGAGAYTLAASAGSAGASGGTALGVTGNITNNSTNLQTLNLTLGFGTTRTVDTSSGNITISGVISGAGGLIKEGSSTLTLSAANSYTGNTTINNGMLAIGGSNVLTGNVTINSGATLDGGNNHGPVTSSTNLIINGGTVIGGYTQQLASVTMTNGTLQGHSLFNGGIDNYYVTGGWTLAGNNTITGGIDMRSVQASSGTFNTTSGTTTISGTIGNTQGAQILGVTKNGSGTLTLTGNNTYGGTTTLNAGQLNINNATALGTSAFTIVSGTIDNTSAAAITLTNNNAQNWNGNFTMTGTRDLNMGTGNVAMNASRTVTVNAGNFTVGGVISGSGFGLTKSGSGMMILTGNNTYSGATTIIAGTLEIGGSGQLGGGSYAGNIVMAGAFTYNSTSNQTLSGQLSGGGAIIKYRSGTLTLSGNNTFLGGLTMGHNVNNITGGTVKVLHDKALGTGLTVWENDGTIELGANGLTISNAVLIGNRASATDAKRRYRLDLAGSNTGTLSGNFDLRMGALVLDVGTDDTLTLSGNFSTGAGAGGFEKTGDGTAVLTGASNTATGTTVISAGTLQIGAGGTTGTLNTAAVTNNGTLVFNRSNALTVANVISGTGALVQEGSSTLTVSASNTYSGGTTLNSGTLVIGNTAAAGNGTITQTNGSSLLKFDTTGTIANAMSIFNVSANKTVTLSGGITVNNAVFDVASGETLTISNTINGTGGVTKNGTGTLVLSGNNTYSAATVINAGTLEAANAGALGSNNTVQVTGGTLLVTADDAINGKNIELGGSGIGLQFSGNYSGAIGNLTLSANSIIDLGSGSVQILFQGLNSSNHTLSFYNWSGTTLWNGGNGTTDTDKVYFGPDLSDEALAKIYFYTGPGDSFLGSGFDLGLKATGFTPAMGHQIIPVPEPETYATGLLLLLGGAWWMWKRNRNTCQRALAGQPAEGSPKGETRPWEGRDRLPKAAPQEEQIGKSANQTSGSEQGNA